MSRLVIQRVAHTNRPLTSFYRAWRSVNDIERRVEIEAGETAVVEIEIDSKLTVDALVMGSDGNCTYALENGDVSALFDMGHAVPFEWFTGCGYDCPLLTGTNEITIVNNGDETASVVVAVASTEEEKE